MRVGGEGKEFPFILYVSQVNKVILGSLPCQQVLGRAWVLYVAEKKQLFPIPLLPWRTLYVCRRVEGNTPPPQHEWLLSHSRHRWASYFWETAYNRINLTGLWIVLHVCVVFNVQPGLQFCRCWALLLIFSLALNLLILARKPIYV